MRYFLLLFLYSVNSLAVTNTTKVFVDIDKTVTLIKNHKTEFGVCFAKVYRKDLKAGVAHLCEPKGNKCPSYEECVGPKNIDMRLVFDGQCSYVERNCNGGTVSKSNGKCFFKGASCEIGSFINERDGYEFLPAEKDISCKIPKSGNCGNANSCSRGL